jgi:hypothetical protein
MKIHYREGYFHTSAWKKKEEFSEGRLEGIPKIGCRSYLLLFRWLRHHSNNMSASIAVSAVKVLRLVPEGGVCASTIPSGLVYSENSGS